MKRLKGDVKSKKRIASGARAMGTSNIWKTCMLYGGDKTQKRTITRERIIPKPAKKTGFFPDLEKRRNVVANAR